MRSCDKGRLMMNKAYRDIIQVGANMDIDCKIIISLHRGGNYCDG